MNFILSLFIFTPFVLSKFDHLHVLWANINGVILQSMRPYFPFITLTPTIWILLWLGSPDHVRETKACSWLLAGPWWRPQTVFCFHDYGLHLILRDCSCITHFRGNIFLLCDHLFPLTMSPYFFLPRVFGMYRVQEENEEFFTVAHFSSVLFLDSLSICL